MSLLENRARPALGYTPWPEPATEWEYPRFVLPFLTCEAEKMSNTLSDEAIVLAFGWFSRGSKSTVTSSLPHANMKANQSALNELLAADLIEHRHEKHSRHGIDRHHFQGTSAVTDMLQTPHAKTVLKAMLKAALTKPDASQ